MEQNLAITKLLKHADPGSLNEIGCGSYSRVYKLLFKHELCDDALGSEKCRFCHKIADNTTISLKQFFMSSLYDHDDYQCEINYQLQIYQKYPDLILKIYDHWVHETDDIPELAPPIFPAPPKSIQIDNIYKTGFIITEFMPDLDLNTYFKSIASSIGQTQQQISQCKPYINMFGLLFILINIIYILHYEFDATHGDFRDRNIFLRYKGPDWKQHCTGGYLKSNVIYIDTGGWEIKLGDFGLADKILLGEGSFIIRDYEFLDNIYCQRSKWRHTCSSDMFQKIIVFIKTEFLEDIYDRISKYRRNGQNIVDARHIFWFSKHRISPNSIFIQELPHRMLYKFTQIMPGLPFIAI